MTAFGWLTLLTCAAAGTAACFPKGAAIARGLGCAAGAFLVGSLISQANAGAFADLIAVDTTLWRRAAGAVVGALVFGLGMALLIDWNDVHKP